MASDNQRRNIVIIGMCVPPHDAAADAHSRVFDGTRSTPHAVEY